MNDTPGHLEAARDFIARVLSAMKNSPKYPVGDMFICGCVGPLPECRCMKMFRLVKEFSGYDPKREQ